MSIQKYRNRSAIRSGKYTGAHLQEAFDDLRSMIQNLAAQVNANPHGPVDAPPQVSSISATSFNNGFVQIDIHDNNPVRRGITYHVEASDTPGFEAARLIHSGPSRSPAPLFVGNKTIYLRAFSQYPTSNPSSPIYSTPVQGGGTIAGPSFSSSAGSGTGQSVATDNGNGFGSLGFRPGSPRLPV